MSFITRLALRRRPVTILIVIMLFALGVYSYVNLQRELFPDIEFPNVAVNAFTANSDPETMIRDVTEPVEDAISGISGLREIRSVSTDSRLNLLATFDFDTDMAEAEREVESAVNGADLPGAVTVVVSRITSDVFPVIQFTVSGDEDIPGLQRLVSDVIEPRLSRIEGVGTIFTLGEIEEQVIISLDADKLNDLRVSSMQVADAITQNNISLPAGSIATRGTDYLIRTANELGSMEDIRELTVAFEHAETGIPQAPQSPQTGKRAIKVSDVADVELTTAEPQRISRANGKPGLILAVVKDPDANTADVTDAVSAAIQEMLEQSVIPPHVEVLELSNNGPQVREALESLLREGTIGFLFAVAVVFIFLLNVRPSLMRGITLSLRPTAIIAISIPLSLLTGVLLLSFTDISLNFMSLAGLAIAVGRVVDDSIVVLENIYRHIHLGESRFEAAVNGTQEVGAAIIASTLTTVVIFIPLAFISGVVGQFFSPFAISVSLALLASTAVAITIVPVLAASLLRRGDFQADAISDSGPADRQSMIQRIYTPMLLWSLRHKFLTIAAALIVTLSSIGLVSVIPITFFPETTPEYLTVNIELPIGSSVERTYQEALKVEESLVPFVERGWITIYQTTVGGRAEEFDSGAAGGFHLAGAFIRLSEDVPEDIENRVRAAVPEGGEDALITVSAVGGAGPPAGDLEINVAGSNFNEISDVSRRLEERLAAIDGIVNVSSTVSEGKDEVVISVDPTKAGEYSLTTIAVGAQVNQFIVGREISEMDVGGKTVDIVLRGERADVEDIDALKNLRIESPAGPVKLGVIADIGIKEAPLSIFRFDSERSALITGNIIAEDTRAVGVLVQQEIDNLEDVPPGVSIVTGGIFEQINEGFQDIFIAMAVGVILVYLVMVATLGALRTPFVIVLSLPLAIVGALVALLVTGRTLSLSAMMGFLLLVGIVVTNAIVLLTFVEQLRERGYDIFDAIVEGGRVRLRPILMTAFTTTFALLPLAASDTDSGIIGAELATVVIGGLVSSTFLTLLVVPSMYWIFNVSIPGLFASIGRALRRTPRAEVAQPE